MKHIVLLNSDKREPIEQLQTREDLFVSVITKPKYTALYGWADQVLEVCDIADVGEVLQAALNAACHGPIDAVVCPFERALLPGGFIRSNLDVPGLSYDSSARLANKLVMKRCLREHSLPTASFRRVDGIDRLKEVGQTLGWPLIVKPAIGSGSYGTAVIASAEELDRMLADGGLDSLTAARTPLIAERFIEMNAEYHCDGIVSGGEVRFAAVSRYIAPVLQSVGRFVGSCVLPSHSPDAVKIRELHVKTVQALGLENGVTHLEVYGTQDGLIVGEMTCRPAGGGIPANVERHTGVSLWNAFIQTALGEFFEIHEQEKTGISGWLGLPLGNGTIRRITSADELLAVEGVNKVELTVQAGDKVRERQTSVLYAGKLFFHAADEPEVRRILEQIQNLYRIEQSEEETDSEENRRIRAGGVR